MTLFARCFLLVFCQLGVGGLLFSILSAMFAITSSLNRG